jgi:hypothetical protein
MFFHGALLVVNYLSPGRSRGGFLSAFNVKNLERSQKGSEQHEFHH